MTELGITLFHGGEFSEGEISPGVDHYPPRRDVAGICLFIDYFCLNISQRCVFGFVLQAVSGAMYSTIVLQFIYCFWVKDLLSLNLRGCCNSAALSYPAVTEYRNHEVLMMVLHPENPSVSTETSIRPE